MARKPRLHVAGGLYHVTLRGNHRQSIFFCDSDRTALESFVADSVTRHAARVHAYCWMTNHIHLLVQVSVDPLGRIMQRIGTRYARFVQRRVDTTGHLFERRYHALLVDSDRYLLTLVRYIHMNPVRGGLVVDAAEYPWSSHRCYLGSESRPWLITDLALGMLATSPGAARAAYRDRLMAEQPGGVPSPLTGRGGSDPRVLGDDDFLARLPQPTGSRAAGVTLDDLVRRACEKFSVTPSDLASRSRARTLNRVRTIILRQALDERVASCSEVARRFGRSVAALSRSADRARKKAAEADIAPAAPCASELVPGA
ncbi:MAG: transposase [Steroidobacteraceae bacterium]|nr:transposase [Steroidobacteraceae bacterium]